MDHKGIRSNGYARNGRDVAGEIETELVVQSCVNCVRRTADEERVAVCWQTNDRLGRQIAASASPIFDDEWLAESFRQPMANQTREDVKRAACTKADEDAHRTRRIKLRPCDPRHRRQRGSARGQMQECAAGKFHGIPHLVLRGCMLFQQRRAYRGTKNECGSSHAGSLAHPGIPLVRRRIEPRVEAVKYL